MKNRSCFVFLIGEAGKPKARFRVFYLVGTFSSAISTQAKIMKQEKARELVRRENQRQRQIETGTERQETKIQRQAETERRNQPLVANSLLSSYS